ncbi:MAG TPA: hypothetical protein PLF97_00345 [Candidatus Pacearchaeota archaeon]|nr:hypothetical protein [Candidatus Pacearchaeota archaeon]
MKKRRIVALLFFLLGVVIITMEVFPKENISLEKKDDVILSLKSKAASAIDSIAGNDNVEGTIEKVISSTQEVVNDTKDNVVEYVEQETEKIIAPINNVTNSLTRQLTLWLLSLLNPEEVREILAKDFDVDICR